MTKHIHGGDIYRYDHILDFSANCNPLGTPESVKEAVVESLDRISDYPQVGYAPLREAIAAYEGVKPSQVICGNGAAELIFSLCRAVKPGKALVAAPSFAEYEQALQSVDCEITYHMLTKEKGFVLDASFLNGITDDLDILFLCNPNNPTGLLIQPSLMKAVLDKCEENNILLAVDECFLDFVDEPETYSLKESLSACPGLFLLKAFTKRYAMAGVRLGYGLCGNEALLEKMEAVTQPWNLSGMAQAAGIAALKEEEYVHEGREMVFGQAEQMKRIMSGLGLRVYPSEANYIFFEGPKDLFQRCLGENILIRDCSNYTGLSKGFYRVAVKRPEENRQLLCALEKILCSN